jgi:acetyl-CoA carboxylase biotin carboxyl carrier protein
MALMEDSMESKEIRRYAKLMSELDLSSLEISENGSTIKMQRNAPSQAGAVQSAPAPAKAVCETAPQGDYQVNTDDANVYTVASPMVGTFYCAPSEDAQPYVKVGDKVKKGDILCIIEAMKLMNEIASECGGVIEEICLQDKEFVDYGTPLFKIRRG